MPAELARVRRQIGGVVLSNEALFKKKVCALHVRDLLEPQLGDEPILEHPKDPLSPSLSLYRQVKVGGTEITIGPAYDC